MSKISGFSCDSINHLHNKKLQNVASHVLKFSRKLLIMLREMSLETGMIYYDYFRHNFEALKKQKRNEKKILEMYRDINRQNVIFFFYFSYRIATTKVKYRLWEFLRDFCDLNSDKYESLKRKFIRLCRRHP